MSCGFFGDLRRLLESEKLQCGAERKFIVLKIEDINDALNGDEIEEFTKLCNKVSEHRLQKCKTPGNKYIVANVDEPYALDIIEIMKANGHWG